MFSTISFLCLILVVYANYRNCAKYVHGVLMELIAGQDSSEKLYLKPTYYSVSNIRMCFFTDCEEKFTKMNHFLDKLKLSYK